MRNSYPKLHSYKLKHQENVEALNTVTTHDLDPQRVLMGAINERLSDTVVLGFCEDGSFYFASSLADGGTTLWLLEIAKKRLLDSQ